jgi:hypothetical protein
MAPRRVSRSPPRHPWKILGSLGRGAELVVRWNDGMGIIHDGQSAARVDPDRLMLCSLHQLPRLKSVTRHRGDSIGNGTVAE